MKQSEPANNNLFVIDFNGISTGKQQSCGRQRAVTSGNQVLEIEATVLKRLFRQ